MVDISMDGPVIEGTWYNPQTGDSFTVRDSFFQDSQLLIQATDGRVFDYNTIQNYVKSDKPITKQPAKPNSVPSEIEAMLETGNDSRLLPEDLELLNNHSTGPKDCPALRPQQAQQPVVQSTMSEDDIIINRILSRVQGPEVNGVVEWAKFPSKQFDMLIEMMGVEPRAIAEYFVSKVDMNDLREMFIDLVQESIEKTMNVESETPKESTPAKKTSKPRGKN